MSLALMFEDDSVVFLDAVKNYNRTTGGSLTQHRVDKSGVVSDHYAQDNLRINVRGIISAADFNVPSARGQLWIDEFSQQALARTSTEASEASITSSSLFGTSQAGSTVSSLLGVNVNGVQMDAFRGQVHEIVRDKIEEARKSGQSVTLLDMDNTEGGYLRRYEDLYILKFDDNLDDSSGDALYFDLSFEQVRFAVVTEVEATTKVPDSVSKKSNKGDVSSSDSTDSTATERKTTWNEEGGYLDQIKNAAPELLKSLVGG
jgi:hypothetical protein